MTTTMNTIPTSAFDIAASRRIANVRFTDPVDHIMDRYDAETGPANLPSDEQLFANGVDLDVLARALDEGMNAKAFTTALNAGLVDVDSFNNSPFTRTRMERAQFNEGILHLASMANRTSCPVSRVLKTVKPKGMPSKHELRNAGVDLTVLVRAMKMGMCVVDFTVALRAGLIQVDSFNNSPYTRTRSDRKAFNLGVTQLAELAEERIGRQPRQTREVVRTVPSHMVYPYYTPSNN